MNILVKSSFDEDDCVVVRTTLSVHIAHRIAECFTKLRQDDLPLHTMLVSIFGDRCFRWYCIDVSTTSMEITFSDAANPEVLRHCGTPARIAVCDAVPFRLLMSVIEFIKPGNLNPHASHPCAITT